MTDYKKADFGRNADFGDRQSTSAAAKKAQLEKLKAKLNSVDPDVVAARLAVQSAREEREARKRAERDAKLEAERVTKAAREAEIAAQLEAERLALEAEKAARESETRAQAEALEALRAAQKEARDARYAARKKKKRRG
jgi:hypothetical protein